MLYLGSTSVTFDQKLYETRCTLDLVSLNLPNHSSELQVLGSVVVKDKFSSIAWSPKGIPTGNDLSNINNNNNNTSSTSYGFIAGGMSDGCLNLWSVANIINPNKRGQELLVKVPDIHKSEITSLQFHPKLHNLLASGSTDGEVYIWDCQTLTDPKPARPNATKPGIILNPFFFLFLKLIFY